jgi:hypothetical protein
MGWSDSHLHRFRIYGKDFGVYHIGGPIFADNPKKARLADFHFRLGERFLYESTGCGFRVGKARDCGIENTIARKRERTKADGKDLGQRTRQWDGARTCDILTHLRPF